MKFTITVSGQTEHILFVFICSPNHLLLHFLGLIDSSIPLCWALLGLNKDFKKMLSAHAEFKALHLKDMIPASDGTKKVNMSTGGLVTNPCIAS